MALSTDVIPNRSLLPAIILQEAWKAASGICSGTIAILSKMPPVSVDAFRAMLKGGILHVSLCEAVHIRRSPPNGLVARVPGVLRWQVTVRILDRRGGFQHGKIVDRSFCKIPFSSSGRGPCM